MTTEDHGVRDVDALPPTSVRSTATNRTTTNDRAAPYVGEAPRPLLFLPNAVRLPPHGGATATGCTCMSMANIAGCPMADPSDRARLAFEPLQARNAAADREADRARQYRASEREAAERRLEEHLRAAQDRNRGHNQSGARHKPRGP